MSIKITQNVKEKEVQAKLITESELSPSKKGTTFLQEVLGFFSYIIKYFHLESYDSAMDFAALLDSGDYAPIHQTNRIVGHLLIIFVHFTGNKFVKEVNGRQLKRGSELKLYVP